MRPVLNFFQGLFILFWTLFCGLFGVVIMLFTWNSRLVVQFVGVWLYSPLVLWVCGVRLHVNGRENIDPHTPSIYVSNHESQLDIPAVCVALKLPLFFIAKNELKKIPIVGWYMMAVGHIFIDRSNREKAMESMRIAALKIKKGKNVISFPEGTRTKDGKIKLFRRGSFMIASKGDVGVVPVSIKGTREVLPSGSFKVKGGDVYVNIGRPIYHRNLKDLEIDEFAAHVRGVVVELRKEFP